MKYALYPGNSHSVIADGYSGIYYREQAVAQLPGGNHAASALDDQRIIRYRAFDLV